MLSEGQHGVGITPRSKTAHKLAALQVSNAAYTPSPVPLRRRLHQQHSDLQKDAVCHMLQDSCEVICID